MDREIRRYLVLVNCTIDGYNHTCSCALIGKKRTMTRVCLRAVQASTLHLHALRLCRACTFRLALYTWRTLITVHFFPFVHRA